ncbi:hypothetical protein WDU94_013708 [Cyamophila willieti]
MRVLFAFVLVAVVVATFTEAATKVGPGVGNESDSSVMDCSYCARHQGICRRNINNCDLPGGGTWHWSKNPNGKYQWHKLP